MIPYGRQDINKEDVDAVVSVLQSDFLTQGPVVPQFEQSVADYVGAKYAVAVNSATAALHIACMALDLRPGDWVWTSPNTFVASANCARYCGANVDFVDIDPKSYNLSTGALKAKLEMAELQGKLPKIVIPVHFAGQSCDMHEIHALSKQYGFRIIEDASHAIGGKYQDNYVGSCHYSDITVFSFHPVKIITTGEGGMALTNDPKLAEKMARLRTHGITRDAEQMTHRPDGPWYYQQIELGLNYRMTDIHAALGLSQLNRLDQYIARRVEIARRYDEHFLGLPITTPWQDSNRKSAWHLYVIRLKLDKIRTTHLEVFDWLRRSGIGVNLHYIPVHTQPYYQGLGFSSGDFPESERYYEQAISLPMFATLTKSQQDKVVLAMKQAVQS